MINKICLLIGVLLLTKFASSQSITLNQCLKAAATNYPIVKKSALLRDADVLLKDNTRKAFLPQVNISAQGTYQNEVTKLPIKLPNVTVPEMSKDQYRLQAEISQLIYDGGTTKVNRELIASNTAIQLQQLEVSLYNVKERVLQNYFAILMFDAQLRQRVILQQNIEAALQKSTAALANGTTYRSTVDELNAELLNVQALQLEAKADRKTSIEVLSFFTSMHISEDANFAMPKSVQVDSIVLRPEINLFSLQHKALLVQERKLKTEWMPKLSAFLQGGYGRPGLNMLLNEFRPFVLGGIRVLLPLSSLYTYQNNRKLLALNSKQVDVDKEVFLFNIRMQLRKEQGDVEKYRQLLVNDDKVIALRNSVVASAKAQLDNGVITTADFIQKLNAENTARELKSVHELLLLKSIYQQLIISGQ